MELKAWTILRHGALWTGMLLGLTSALLGQQLAVQPIETPTFDRQDGDVLRSSAADVSFAAITGAGLDAATAATDLHLLLFDRRRVLAVPEHVAFPLPGTLTWAGRVEGEAGSRVILAVTGTRVDGLIYLADAVYEIRSGNESHVLAELDTASLSPQDCIVPTDPPTLGPRKEAASDLDADDGTVIDVMVAYSPQATAGGEATLRNRIALGIEVGNDILRTSRINTRFRLVHSGSFDLDESAPLYSNNGAILIDRLVEPGDGFYDDLHPLRDQFAADLTVVVVNDLRLGLRGVAAGVMEGADPTFESKAFAVVQRGSISGFVLAHELGHLMGSHHDRGSFSTTPVPTTGAFAFSFAYADPGGQLKTVMASGVTAPLNPVLQFSSPNLTVNGQVAGSADEDNARSIEAVRGVVANFRSSAGHCGSQVGSADFCAACGPCSEGQGDCDSDAECGAGLVCVEDVGPDFGFGPRVDVCLPAGALCTRPLGDPSYCLDPACGPCDVGEGDCDPNHTQCLPGLVCSENVGANYGFAPNIDVCEDPGGACALPPGHPDFCEDPACGPCGAGGGDCDPFEGECLPGLVCSENVGPECGFGPNVDVCESPSSLEVLTLEPSGDAFVASDWPGGNYGGEADLRVRYAGGDGQGHGRFSFLRFDVPQLPGSVLSATLRLRTQNVPIGEVGYYAVDLPPWNEMQITWSNWGDPAQATFLGSVLNLSPYTWIEFDVTVGVDAGGGVVTFRLVAGSSSDFGNQDFYSRETLSSPQLVIHHD